MLEHTPTPAPTAPTDKLQAMLRELYITHGTPPVHTSLGQAIIAAIEEARVNANAKNTADSLPHRLVYALDGYVEEYELGNIFAALKLEPPSREVDVTVNFDVNIDVHATLTYNFDATTDEYTYDQDDLDAIISAHMPNDGALVPYSVEVIAD